MRVEVVTSLPSTAHVIRNLYPLYLHDLSDFSGDVPNPQGAGGRAGGRGVGRHAATEVFQRSPGGGNWPCSRRIRGRERSGAASSASTPAGGLRRRSARPAGAATTYVLRFDNSSPPAS